MTQAGFFETRQFSPTSLTLIIALHAAAVTTALAWKMDFITLRPTETEVTFVDLPKAPPEPSAEETEPRPIQRDVYVPPSTSPLPPDDQQFTSTTEDLLTQLPPVPDVQPLPPLPDPGPRVQAAPAKGDVRRLFSPDDYPEAARRRDETGTVQARLVIGANGKVTGCSIVTSSGSSALDAATCRVLRDRAKFTPAKSSSGEPVSDTYVTPRIVWQIEGRG